MSDCCDRHAHLRETDPQLYALIERQIEAESTTLKMIASENYASFSVLEASGSILTNKYCEGYPQARYYEGNEIVDQIEQLAIDRAKSLFGAEHANVQPYSGSPANQAVYRALLEPGDKVMGMPVPAGGHLTHGWKVNFSGRDYRQIPYGPDPETGLLDFGEIRRIARQERPKMIWVGATAYPRALQYDRFAEIAAEVDAYLVADIAHINGLIVAGVHPDPVPYCDVVSSTIHKMLRGPRAGFILSKEEDRFQQKYHSSSKFNLAKRIDRAVFPGLQGGPHMNTIAAMATCFKEADSDAFRRYGAQVAANARRLAEALLSRGYQLAGGGTDTHLLILDFRAAEYTGKDVAQALARAGIIGNFNMVPGDHRKPFVTSGVRLGTPAVTSMGMREAEMEKLAAWIDEVCSNMGSLEQIVPKVRGEVAEFCRQFAIPGIHAAKTAD
ncbi:MAG: serine hydroxymethyltransferase [Pirellulaceae bacterium]|jgi:glycine hydroxymethyltransferase|nr:serine hydroxymethyltransferase [Thermoguttaceae bacterium]MDI9445090.1 serine hydroxymethyltransferase [Planctomycetota bacterium]NLY99489.1 serine hydroxymethyltransferase [Pirellulaceae bacterium]